MKEFLSRIDFHVLYLLLILIPIAVLGLRVPWTAITVGLVPQFLVLTNVSDWHRSGKPWRAYLFANELLIGAAVIVSTFLDRAAS